MLCAYLSSIQTYIFDMYRAHSKCLLRCNIYTIYIYIYMYIRHTYQNIFRTYPNMSEHTNRTHPNIRIEHIRTHPDPSKHIRKRPNMFTNVAKCQSIQSKFKKVRTFPKVSEHVGRHLKASKHIQTRPTTSKNVQNCDKLMKTAKRWKSLSPTKREKRCYMWGLSWERLLRFPARSLEFQPNLEY